MLNFFKISGRGSARLERLLWEQDVTGSNPVAPTIFDNMFVVPVAQLDRATAF